MKEKKLLVRLPDRIDKGITRSLYGINPAILNSYKDDQPAPNIPEALVNELLDWLDISSSSDGARILAITIWSSKKMLDFGTFLLFFQSLAYKWKSSSSNTIEDAEEMYQFLREYIDLLEKESLIRPRQLTIITNKMRQMRENPVSMSSFHHLLDQI
jgi:hypothetical protein